MFDRLMTGWTRVGAHEIHVRMIGKAVADDDAWESIFREIDACASGVGSGAKDRRANPFANHELGSGFTWPTILIDRQDHQIKVRLINRLGHPLEDRDVIRRR